ncbi:MAG: ISAs1 family transposase [Verrucomicrobiae bacterium]|nr:ISAs1 family transposase [Verrucomicrobiae bacterium]
MHATPDSDDPAARSLMEHFGELPDPRVERTRQHRLIDILVIGICTLLCGGEGFNDMEDFGHAKEPWLRSFLELPGGIPSHDTFNRVFSALEPGRFLECFLRWTQALRRAVDGEIVAMDGKALRRAARGGSVPHIVSAWAAENGLVLGQVRVGDKSNEITAVPELLRALELAGCIVTLDAMGCQRRIAREIAEADADYVLALKGNQGTVHQEVRDYLDDAILNHPSELGQTQSIEKDHGRIETRRYWQGDRLEWFADRAKWQKLRSVGVVESVRETAGTLQTERRYYLSSLPLDPARFARAVRGHWSVENQLHWVLDVQFSEDQSRARSGYAAENLATLRRLALNLLKRDTSKRRGIRAKQKNAGWDHRYLLHLLRPE